MFEPRKLLTFEFLGLCVVTFVAICNVTVFYNLFNHLWTLGIPADQGGLVIGSYSLTAMVLYLLVSPFLTAANAPRTMLLGMAVVALCGMNYLFIHSFWGLLGLRMMNGFGQFLMGAGAMTLLVSVIPKEKSGQAFAIYSVAILLPFGAVPAVMDALAFFIPTPPHGYAGATVTLIPAVWIVWHIRRRRGEQSGMVERKHIPAWSDIRANITQLPVALLLLLNTIYIINWSSMFFLFKGFADQQGIINVGAFFTVQMGLMIVLRLLAGRLIDTVDKTRMVMAMFAVIALGHLALDNLPGAWAIPLVALIFGVGMGMGQPTIHSLMFEVTAPNFRPLNANLMLFSTQAGFFLGPVLGGALIVRWGYHGYFLFSIGLALAAVFIGIPLAGKR
ncbi:MAG: MFS transporter [Deltaproteobacteria bacterium]|nr:MFS transporter [Deltaproteobacteria bacterium]